MTGCSTCLSRPSNRHGCDYERLSATFHVHHERGPDYCHLLHGWLPGSGQPVEPWMAALIPAGEYVVQIAGRPLVLRPMPGRQADIQRGHEYYHYTIGGRLYAGTFVGRDSG